MPDVELRFSPLPAHVRTARLLAASVGRRFGLDEELIDEVKLAVGEACTRAVGLHRTHDTSDDVVVTLGADAGRYTITVQDSGPGGASTEVTDPLALVEAADASESPLPPDFSLAVIAGLVDDVDVRDSGAGTLIRMSWPTSAETLS